MKRERVGRRLLLGVSVTLMGLLLVTSSAQAQVLSNTPILSDSGPALCYTDFYLDPEQCNESSFTFPSGLTGVVRSSVHPSFFPQVGVNYQIAVTGGPGSVVSLAVPFFNCPLVDVFDGATSVHILRCGEFFAADCIVSAGDCIVSDATGLDDTAFAGSPAPLGPRVDCYPTAGFPLPAPATPTSSNLIGATYTTGFTGLLAGQTSRIFGSATTGQPILVTAILTNDSGETATVTVKGCGGACCFCLEDADEGETGEEIKPLDQCDDDDLVVCQTTTEDECLALGGTFQAGTSCFDPEACPVPIEVDEDEDGDDDDEDEDGDDEEDD